VGDYFKHDMKGNFQQRRTQCAALHPGGDLAIIPDIFAEARAEAVCGSDECYMGLYKTDRWSAVWQWVDGSVQGCSRTTNAAVKSCETVYDTTGMTPPSDDQMPYNGWQVGSGANLDNMRRGKNEYKESWGRLGSADATGSCKSRWNETIEGFSIVNAGGSDDWR
jgi:hypothetical protein